jgi:hypothetical protein
MPIIARVDGVKIMLYWDEHPPPHFHVEYAEYRAQVAIGTLRIIQGYIPAQQFRKVVAWARPRQNELLEAWMTCQADLNPGRIP